MNIYQTEFFARCPKNGIRIKYELTIETNEVLMVEEIIDSVSSFDCVFHESIADTLRDKFGGYQILKASHHGVQITTYRNIEGRSQ